MSAAIDPGRDLSMYFEGLDGTFVLLDARHGRTLRHDATRAATRFAPCSTFKIPNSAILLETGTATGPDHVLAYDPAYGVRPQWARDFDLDGAFRASALWYYREMVRVLGADATQPFLERFGYGNASVEGGIEGPFWVDGSLRISADEQVAFLQAFNEDRLDLSPRTTQSLRAIMLVEETPSWRLHAKTGACQPEGEETANWYVGYVEKGEDTYYFAIQLGAPDYGRAFEQRVPLARRILSDLGILD